MAKERECLFIGGCKDGQWFGVHNDADIIWIYDYTLFHPTKVPYYRDVLMDADETRHVVYVAAEVKGHIIAHLLQGYSNDYRT